MTREALADAQSSLQGEIAALQARLTCAQEDAEDLRNPMACGHYEANLQPTDGPGEACIVCGEIGEWKATLRRVVAALRRADAFLDAEDAGGEELQQFGRVIAARATLRSVLADFPAGGEEVGFSDAG